jgi:hypothetical protein
MKKWLVIQIVTSEEIGLVDKILISVLNIFQNSLTSIANLTYHFTVHSRISISHDTTLYAD